MKKMLVCGLAMLLGLTVAYSPAQDKRDNMPPPGFTALFNGRDLTNWQGLVPINQRSKPSVASAWNCSASVPMP